MYQPVRRSLTVALSEHGLSRDRIVAIVVSHLHFDHAGALGEFPGIPIHVQREELEAARQPRYTVRSRIEDPALRYLEHEGDTEIFEGIRLIATPGHTPGHQSVAVKTDDGLAILACQSAYVLEEWADPFFQHVAGAASALDRDRYAESLEKLRSMSPIEVRFSHDRRVWRAAGIAREAGR
jgi:N-acyl homoserine lactone hydrolase